MPVFVRDVYPGASGSSISNLTVSNGFLYFTAQNGLDGIELWRTSLIDNATVQLDIRTGANGSNPSSLVDVNGTLYFVADDGVHRSQLWKVDPTTGNPVLLEIPDSNPVPGYISIRSLTNVGGRLYIDRYNGYYGNSSFYTIDADTNLPAVVADLGGVTNITNINGILYFSAYSISNNTGDELWKIDPATNTSTLIEVNPGGGSSSPSNFTLVDSTLFFTANNDTSGTELWKLDASGNPVLVKDIRLNGGSSPSNLFSAGTKLYFTVDDGTHGLELWQSDGTEAGTVLTKDINGRTFSSSPNSLIDVNGILYFVADDGIHGSELWKVDPTTGNPVLLEITDTSPYAYSAYIRSLINVGGRLYIDRYNPNAGDSLYTINSETGFPEAIEGLTGISNISNINETLYFSAYGIRNNTGYELWKIDPATNTPALIEVNPGGGSSSPSNFTLVNGTLFFTAYDATSGRELWKLDGAGTPVLIDVNPALSSNPNSLIDINGTLFFAANNDTNGRELWKITPTDTAATLIDIYPGDNSSSPSNFINVDGTLFFNAYNPTSGQELWKIAPTDTAATLIDIYSGNGSSSPSNFINVNNSLFFVANNAAGGRELWKISPADTTATLIDVYLGFNPSAPDNLTNVNGTLYFTEYGYNGVNYTGRELWKISPNTISPVLIDIAIGNGSSSPQNLLNVNGTLYFTASNPDSGLELWQLDATDNPVRLSDIQTGEASSSPGNLTYSNGKLYFTADNATQGVELWAIDVNSVTVSGNITKSAAEDNSITFAATDFSSVFAGGTLNKIKISALPSNGLLKLGDNSIIVDQEIALADLDNLLFIPNNNFNGTVGFTWSGSDGTTYSPNPATASLSFSPVNDAPQILNPIGNRSSYTGNPLNFGIPNSFQDVDFGDTLTLTATLTDGTALPTWLTFSAGNFSGTAPQGSAGTYEIKVTAKDASNLTATDNFIYTILEGAPYSIDLSPFTVAENSTNNTLIGNLSSLDPNAGDTFTYTLLDNAGGRFAIVGNQLQVADSSLLDFEALQQHIIRVRTTDSTNLTYERDVAVNVSNVNDTNPGILSFSAANYSVNEDGTLIVAVTVSRTGGNEGFVRAFVSLSPGTATAPSDYNLSSIAVEFANGEISKTVTIPVINDSFTETNETVNLTLANPQGGAVLGAQITAVLTIVDDDPLLPGTITFESGSYSIDENGTPIITILRTGGSNGAVTVDILPTDGTAISPDDYASSPITITFAEGEISKNVTIPIVSDGKFEFYETVNLKLSNPTGGANLGEVDTAKLVISPNFTLNGVAKQSTSFDNTAPVLRLTDGLGQSGSAFLTDRISLSNQASFSTSFQFQVSSPQGGSDEDGQGADGFVFVVQTVANNVGGAGGGLGYAGINNSLGIEFDTYNNGGVDDNSGNHVGIDINGNIDSVVTQSIPTRLNDGSIWTAWVDYNGASDLLEVRLSSTNQRPDNALLSYQIDLAATLQSTDAFIGFTSGTGGAGGVHDILNWDFKTTYQPISAGKINFSSPVYTIGENGESTAAITVNRTGGNNGAVSAVILLSDGTALSGSDYLNNSITVSFADGETSKVVTLSSLIINDTTYEQTENLTLTLSAPTGGATIGTQSTSSLSIIDNDLQPTLSLVITPQTSAESDGSISGTVTRNLGLDSDLVVNLVNSDSSQITIPATVTILAGQTSANFSVGIIDDTLVETTRSYSVTGTATGFISAIDNFQITDNDAVNLSIAISQSSINENNGKATVTITRDVTTATPLVVQLTGNSNVSLPNQVIIAAGQSTATFEVEAIDDNLLNGDQTLAITAKPTYTNTGVATPNGSATANLIIIDNEAPSLQLSIDKDIIAEGTTANVTVTRNNGVTGDLVVDLTNSNTSQATIPSTVTILAGQTSATFAVTGVIDGINDGSQAVTLTASATGLNSSSDVLEITDINVPDLVVSQLSTAQPTYTSQQAQFTYQVTNNGISAATGTWKDRIYLSKDNRLDAQDTLLGEFSTGTTVNPTNLLPGLNYGRSVTYFTPRTPGQYYLIATTDSANEIAEGTGITETNNTTVSVFNLTAAYRGVVNTAVASAVAGTPIVLTGQAISNISNAPVPFEFVTIAVKHLPSGTVREIVAFTNASGNFTGTFTPLQNEGGQYEINAYFPGNTTEDTAPEDSFKILGMQFTTSGVTQKIISDSTFTGVLSLQNLTDISLTGITATILGAPADWTVQVNAPATLAGDATNSISYTITAPNSSNVAFDRFGIQLTSSEGATTTIPLDITLERTLPRLVASPTALTNGMLRGEQTLVNFQITNEGGAATGDIEVVIPPSFTWLKLASSGKVASLAPGESATLTALLTPNANLDLTLYQGNLFFDIAGNDGDLSLPFSFRAVSTATGSLKVDVTDELSYFQAGNPHLQGATVILRDYFTNDIVREVVTDATGMIDWSGLAEGAYKLEVTADNHDTYRQTIQIDAGESEVVDSFLSRQTVRYTWNVTPTEIEDQYSISIQSTFETNVPVPTVTIDPPSIDLANLQVIGQTIQVDMTLTNHGLIAAKNVSLGFGDHPFYKIEPLVGSTGLLSAKSSLTVPVKITRIADFDGTNADVPCQISAGMVYSYEVIRQGAQTSNLPPILIERSVPIPILNVEGNCLPPIIGNTVIDFPNFYGSGGSTGGGGGSYTVPIDISPVIEGVQARVKISIDQEAVTTRSAFLGSLEIDNGNETSLENLLVALEIRDQNGVIVNNNLFGITQPILRGITAVDGTGILTGNNPTTPIDEGIGSARWTFIPTNLAALEVPTKYTIGGQLSYTENGARITVPLIAAPITVFPQAELYLDYFQQRNVYGDDPFTSNIETAVPFSLGVLVRNEGKGDAKNLRITSSQPKIIENQQGLLVDFEIIGSQVNGTGVSPSLAVNFGDIAAGGTAIADWQLKSSIQGKFSDYKATFEHVNNLGIKELSLIKEVKVHELIHQVQADRAIGDDNLPDFLVNDVADANFRPETLYFSNGGTAPVAFAVGTADALIVPSDKVAEITASTTPGWSYIELVDPAAGQYQIKSVVRSDGKVIKADNVWLTDRTFPETGRPTYENILHLLDFDSTGSYTITYTNGDAVSPTVDIIDVTPDPRTTAAGAIDVVFSEAIQGSTFDYQDLSLTLNGGANLITSEVAVTLVGDNTYRITGLDTSNDGQYELSLATSGITDLEGNAGTTIATETWTKATDAPAILAINGIANSLRNSAVNSLEVAFSQDINASTLSFDDLSLTFNGGTNLIGANTTITAVSGNTYQIGNIEGLTGNPGNYVFSINATGVQNLAGNAGIGNRSVNWQLDNVQPTVQNINGVNIVNRRQPIQQVEVTFSESIDIATLTASDIILTRNGVAVPLSNLNITSSGNGKYLIEGLAAAQTSDGNYQLTVNGNGVSDVVGNDGNGSAVIAVPSRMK